MSTEIAERAARGPGRPRSPEADRAILDSARALLAEVGYLDLTIEGVAARAGVSKTTIYRRYPSKIALVAAVASRDRDARLPDLDTGSFRGDLVALTRHGVGMVLGSGGLWGRLLPGILAEAAVDPRAGAVVRQFFAWRTEAVKQIVARAIDRGEARVDTDPDLVFDLVSGPLLARLMITGQPLDGRFAEALVEEVIEGVGAR